MSSGVASTTSLRRSMGPRDREVALQVDADHRHVVDRGPVAEPDVDGGERVDHVGVGQETAVGEQHGTARTDGGRDVGEVVGETVEHLRRLHRLGRAARALGLVLVHDRGDDTAGQHGDTQHAVGDAHPALRGESRHQSYLPCQ